MLDNSDSAWDVLGLDAEAADQRAVKRAYARLIKTCRPESDPEGFQRARQAYEWALEWLERREHEAAESGGISAVDENGVQIPVLEGEGGTPSSYQPPAKHLAPSVFMDAESQLRARLESGSDSSAAAAALRHFIQTGIQSPSRRFLIPALEQIFSDRVPLLMELISVEDLAAMIVEELSDLPQSVAIHWRQTAQYDRLIALGRLLEKSSQRIHSADTAACFARIADLLSFAHPPLAERLANSAYPHLQPGMREWIMQRVDHRLAIGKLFAKLPKEQTFFWEERLFFSGEKTLTWDDPASRAALWQLTRTHASNWPGYVLLQQVVPAQVLARFRTSIRTAEAPKRNQGQIVWMVVILAGLIAVNWNRITGGSAKAARNRDSNSRLLDVHKMPPPPVTSAAPRPGVGMFGASQALREIARLPNASVQQRAETRQYLRGKYNDLDYELERFSKERTQPELLRVLTRTQASREIQFSFLLCILYDPLFEDYSQALALDVFSQRLPSSLLIPVCAKLYDKPPWETHPKLNQRIRSLCSDYFIESLFPLAPDIREALLTVLPDHPRLGPLVPLGDGLKPPHSEAESPLLETPQPADTTTQKLRP